MKNVSIIEITNGFIVYFAEGKKRQEIFYSLLSEALKSIKHFYEVGFKTN